MSFVSWQYPLLLAILYLLYWRVPQGMRVVLITAASYFFYGCWDPRFLTLILGTTCVDFLCGRLLAGERVPPWKSAALLLSPAMWLGICTLIPGLEKVTLGMAGLAAAIGVAVFAIMTRLGPALPGEMRRGPVVLSICFNLLILGFFKYFGFFVESMEALLTSLGLAPTLPILAIVLPVGISFYTFQSLSYIIDVYRGKTESCRHFFDYAAYISFFPQLVAGPIERSTDLLPQILKERTFELDHLGVGCRLILVGLFKKLFVADNCALIANYAFEPGTPLNAPWAILGAVAFAFQIYGDFSGYTDIARGSARMLGIHLQQNFRYPYLAQGPSDFWQRWHISLSSWFRDYVYIPLGGNRKGGARTIINLLLTMLIAGLWHGASWNFVLWGAFHGILLVGYRLTPGLSQLEAAKGFGRLPAIVLMFAFTLVGWALFRSADLAAFGNWFTALANWDSTTAPEWVRPLKFLLFHLGPLWWIQIYSIKQADEVAFGRFHWLVRGGTYAFMGALIACSSGGNQEFIYFQF
jgi:D-alanyl-lipoteichoic acid acyltransferase DltB (MBOAT superfamily)